MHRARRPAIQTRRFLAIGLIALAGLASSCNNDSTLVASNRSESDAALGRCAVFVASKDMVRGPIFTSFESTRLHFNYVALHGQIHIRRRAHFAVYFNPDGTQNKSSSLENAVIRNCNDCEFRGFTSMYSPGVSSLIFNGQHASFRNSVFRDNGWGANRKGQPGNQYFLPSGQQVDIASMAHSDGLSVQFSDYLNVDHCVHYGHGLFQFQNCVSFLVSKYCWST